MHHNDSKQQRRRRSNFHVGPLQDLEKLKSKWLGSKRRLNSNDRLAVLKSCDNRALNWKVAERARLPARAVTRSWAPQHSPGCRLAGQGSRRAPEGRLAAAGKGAEEGTTAGRGRRPPGCKASGWG